MFKQLALITFSQACHADQREALLERLHNFSGAYQSLVRRTVHGANPGDWVWHTHFDSEENWRASGAAALAQSLADDAAVTTVDALAYAPDPVTLRRPDLADGIYRALIVAVEPETPEPTTAQWLSELRAMPDYIPEILNAATGKALWSIGRQRWTHIWEQEFAQLSDLNGPYMQHPYHWGHVDRWFDPEMPCRIVGTDLCHSASEAPDSVIAHYR